jgi:hypothetical protein
MMGPAERPIDAAGGGVMVAGPFNSSLCRISWTDTVHNDQHSSFGSREEVELRFGLEFNPGFWTSFETSQFFVFFCVYRFGGLVERFDHNGVTTQMPGAPGTQLWLGLALGRAEQATGNGTGPAQFRPQIWFMRQGGSSGNLSEFAVAPRDHTFVVEIGGPIGFDIPSERLVGGAGIPPGTPIT